MELTHKSGLLTAESFDVKDGGDILQEAFANSSHSGSYYVGGIPGTNGSKVLLNSRSIASLAEFFGELDKLASATLGLINTDEQTNKNKEFEPDH